MVLFVFQFYPVFNFGKLIKFGLGIVRGERVKTNTRRMYLETGNLVDFLFWFSRETIHIKA